VAFFNSFDAFFMGRIMAGYEPANLR
jgi:hypothetical protein